MPQRPKQFRRRGEPTPEEKEDKRKAFLDRRRGSASSRGYTSRWRKASKQFLYSHPLCLLCMAAGKTVAAGLVDHRIPHRGDMKLFWEQSNWQALCKTCHDRKTATEDSTFAAKGKRPPR
jgi:5-methylcytosine-specific restriction enzyme A